MERRAVVSSALAAIGYDEDTRVLEIQFHPKKSGKSEVWRYPDTDRREYEAFMAPGVSIGKLFHAFKKEHQGYKVVDVPAEAQV